MAYEELCPAWKPSKIEELANAGDKSCVNIAQSSIRDAVSCITSVRTAVLRSKIPQYSAENEDA